jgi:hypothetical protein
MEPGLYAKKMEDGKFFVMKVIDPNTGVGGYEKAMFEFEDQAVGWLLEKGAMIKDGDVVIETGLQGGGSEDRAHSPEPQPLEHIRAGHADARLEQETHSLCSPVYKAQPDAQIASEVSQPGVTSVDTLSEGTGGLSVPQ